MKTIICLSLLIALSVANGELIAQTQGKSDSLDVRLNQQIQNPTFSDSVKKEVEFGLSEQELYKLIRAEFSELITGQSEYALGSFASVETKDSKVTFSPVLISRGGHMLTTTFSGKVADGSSSILNGGEFKQNLSAEVRLHLLGNSGNKSYQYRLRELIDLRSKRIALDAKYATKLYEIERDSLVRADKLNEQQKLKKGLESQLELLEAIIKELNKTTPLPNRDTVYLQRRNIAVDSDTLVKHYQRLLTNIKYPKVDKYPRDSLFLQQGLQKGRTITTKSLPPIDHTIAQLRKTDSLIVASFGSHDLYRKAMKNVVENQSLDEYRTLSITTINPVGFLFRWTSVGLKVSNSEFRLFDQSLPVSDQIISDDYMSYQLNVQHSLYRVKNVGGDLFASIGATFSLTDNLSELSSFKVSTITNYTAERSSTDTKEVYNIQKYEDQIKRLTISGDFIYFFNTNIDNGLRLSPSYIYGVDAAKYFNLDIGLLFPFRKKGDKTAAVTSELFYSFFDLGKQTKSKEELYSKNILGLRFTLPINFKFDLYAPE